MGEQIFSKKVKCLSLGCLSLSLLCFGFSACRIKSPSLEEQQELARRGIFNGGAPAWAGSTAKNNNLKIKDSGAIPENYGALKDNEAYGSLSSEVNQNSESQVTAADDSGSSAQGLEDSPLSRIAKSCPGSDIAARKALLTENLLLRIRRYEALGKRCPSSPDIQTWLAKDYIKSGQKIKAQNSLERALSLDPNFTEAQGLLSTIRN